MIQLTISKRAAVIIATALVLVIPGVAGATHIFTDVLDTNVHAPGIEWVADAGVTAGCGDGSTYCPNDPVSRAQMGTFMHRLSGNAPGIDPSVNADSVDGIQAADLLPTVLTAAQGPFISFEGLDPVADRTFCQINSYTPTKDETVVISGAVSSTPAENSGTILFEFSGQAAVSENGGSTWSLLGTTLPQEVTGDVSNAATSAVGSTELSSGTTYEFGLAFVARSGLGYDTAGDSGRCSLVATFLPR